MLKYIGNGFLDDVPARDLSDEEVIKFGEKVLLDSGLYKKASIEKEVKHGYQSTAKNSSR